MSYPTKINWEKYSIFSYNCIEILGIKCMPFQTCNCCTTLVAPCTPSAVATSGVLPLTGVRDLDYFIDYQKRNSYVTAE